MYSSAYTTCGFIANPYNGTFPPHYYNVGYCQTAYTQNKTFEHDSWQAQATRPAAFTCNQQYDSNVAPHTVSNCNQPHFTISCHSNDIETPTFSGSHDTEKWHNFISLFEKVCTIKGFDTETKCLHLLASLREDALKYADILELRVVKDYDLLKAALAKRFTVSHHESFYRQQFKTRIRFEDETLEQYLQELWYLAEQAFRDDCSNSNILYMLIGDQFISGIQNESLRTHLSLNRMHYGSNGPSMLKDMLKDAELFETLICQPAIKHKPNCNATKGNNYSCPKSILETRISTSEFCPFDSKSNCKKQMSYEQPSTSENSNEVTSFNYKGSSEEISLSDKGSESQITSNVCENKGSETQSFCCRIFENASIQSCKFEVKDSSLGLTCNDISIPCEGDSDLISENLKSSEYCAPSNGDNYEILSPSGDASCSPTQTELSSPLHVDMDMSHVCLETEKSCENDCPLKPLRSSDSSEDSPIMGSNITDHSTLDTGQPGINGKEPITSTNTGEKPHPIFTPEISSQTESLDLSQVQSPNEIKLNLGLKYTEVMYSLSYRARTKVKMKPPSKHLLAHHVCPNDLRQRSDLSFKWKHLQQKRVKMKIFFFFFFCVR